MRQSNLTRYIQANRDYLRRRFDSGASHGQLARESGFHVSSFTRACHRLDVTERTHPHHVRHYIEQHREWITERLRSGYSMRQTARKLKVSHETLCSMAEQWGLRSQHEAPSLEYVTIPHPHEDREVTYRELAAETGLHWKLLSQRYQRGYRGDQLTQPRFEPRQLYISGEWLTTMEAAQKYELPRCVVEQRYQLGWEGSDLVRPRHYHTSGPAEYNLGIPLKVLRDYVREAERIGGWNGFRRVADQTGVPFGALSAISKGEEWRIE